MENAPAFNLKRIDIERAIAVQADEDEYFLAYNNEYWKEYLPEIISDSLLLLVALVGMLIVIKRSLIKDKKDKTL